MTKFSNKFKKHCFWPTFPLFGTKKFYPKKPALSYTTSYIKFLAPCQNLENNNDTISRKHLDRWKDERTDGRTEGQTDLIL